MKPRRVFPGSRFTRPAGADANPDTLVAQIGTEDTTKTEQGGTGTPTPGKGAPAPTPNPTLNTTTNQPLTTGEQFAMGAAVLVIVGGLLYIVTKSKPA